MARKPEVSIMAITPQMAAEYLEHVHPLNRKSRSNRIRLYVADMLAGRWHLSNDAVVFDSKGYLINAANRLNAVVVSNTTQEFIVLRHAPEESKIIMDSGMKRSTDDNFSMAGREWVKGCGAVVRSLIHGAGQSFAMAITDQEVDEFMTNNGEAVEFATRITRGGGRVCKSQIKAVLARAFLKRHSREKLERFAEVLISGESVDASERVIIKFRNWLLDKNQFTRAASKSRATYYGKCERALLAYLNGEELSTIQSPQEELFPIRSIDKGHDAVPLEEAAAGSA